MAGPERKRPPPPAPREEDPEEAAFGAAARARVERFVLLTLVAAVLMFAWSLLRAPSRTAPPSPPAQAAPAK